MQLRCCKSEKGSASSMFTRMNAKSTTGAQPIYRCGIVTSCADSLEWVGDYHLPCVPLTVQARKLESKYNLNQMEARGTLPCIKTTSQHMIQSECTTMLTMLTTLFMDRMSMLNIHSSTKSSATKQQLIEWHCNIFLLRFQNMIRTKLLFEPDP